MVIFHSYVSLPEGNSELQRQQKNVFDLPQDVDTSRPQADSDLHAQRLGEGSADGYFLDKMGAKKNGMGTYHYLSLWILFAKIITGWVNEI